MQTKSGHSTGGVRDDLGKSDRVVSLLILMQGGPPRTAEQLAGLLGVSKRSVFRYLLSLERAGVPHYHDEEAGGYRIRESFFFRPPNLTEEEAVVLSETCRAATRGRSGDAARRLEVAWGKVEGALPRRVRAALRARRA